MGIFHCFEKRFHHFKSFHLVYLMSSFDDIDNYPSKKVLIRVFCYFLWDIHRLVVKVSVWGLDEITKYVVLCSNV